MSRQNLFLGPAIPDLMNIVGDGGKTIYGDSIQLSAQEASWISNDLCMFSQKRQNARVKGYSPPPIKH